MGCSMKPRKGGGRRKSKSGMFGFMMAGTYKPVKHGRKRRKGQIA